MSTNHVIKIEIEQDKPLEEHKPREMPNLRRKTWLAVVLLCLVFWAAIGMLVHHYL